ncbi:MAG: dephospho-CoA kinase [Coriobacteriia bacterium]|nr:dephospho-CoA kinase [Coriobacteriia bacterium]MCL2870925.1 dephospho-CoA kinase [Coriobacteriia bacterium]
MKILAITGPFGSGKTTVTHLVAAALRSAGKKISIIALDEVSRQVVNEDLALRHELADTFGDHVLNDDASLNRVALAELAFADDQSTAQLNALVHPPTIAAARQLIARALEAGELPIVELPFPTVYLSEIFQFDGVDTIVWTVTADKETRLERGIADGYSYEDALCRMDRQPRMSAYQTEADTVIENCDDLDDLRLEVRILIEASPLQG